MTLDNLAHVATVGLYIGKTADSSSYYFGMDAVVTNLFKLNILGKVTAKATVNYKNAEGTILKQLEYETETTGYWGENVLVEYANLPLIGIHLIILREIQQAHGSVTDMKMRST